MPETTMTLVDVFSGWEGYQRSLVSAIEPRTREELLFRPIPGRRSVGELAAHIAFGRADWFHRMGAPGSAELAARIAPLLTPTCEAIDAVAQDPAAIVHWLNAGWEMVENVLRTSTVEDLTKNYELAYHGNIYAVSHQWTIWRIMAHDIHHGGQLTILLGLQGIDLPDLGDNGGHIVEPPIIRKVDVGQVPV